MTVISTTPDISTLTMTIVADLAAPPERARQVWVDPRQLESWWRPPTWPATFVQHDVVVGGRSSYYMTGPDGEKAHGWWRFLAIDEPHSLEFEDGFADEAGVPNSAMPTIHGRVELQETAADANAPSASSSRRNEAAPSDDLLLPGTGDTSRSQPNR